MPRPKKSRAFTLERVAVIAVPIVAFAGGMLVNAFTIAKNIATVPYVDERFASSVKYTDQKTSDILAKAIEHSDNNREKLLAEMKAQSADVRAVAGKQEVILQTVQALQTARFSDASVRSRR